MKALLIAAALFASGFASAETETKREAEAAAADGSKPLELPAYPVMETKAGSPADAKFSSICTTTDGVTTRQGEKGYEDCISKVRVDDAKAGASRKGGPQQQGSSMGVNFKLGK